jgi:hypothetical protein
MDIMFVYYINLYNVISIYRSKKIQSKKKGKKGMVQTKPIGFK